MDLNNKPCLRFGSITGNGVTVWDANTEHEVTKDYLEVCQITEQGRIKWHKDYDRDELGRDDLDMIDQWAENMRVSYLRYSNDQEGFIQECFEQAKEDLMTVGWAKNIWEHLQQMPDPENFKFDMIK